MRMLAIQIPPLSEGVNWDGFSLLNWIVSHSTYEQKRTLEMVKGMLGGPQFRLMLEEKARELNQRYAARRLDGEKAVN